MVEREIIWTETAEKQLQNALDYWLEKNASVEYPKKLLRLVDEYVGYISERPDSYKLTEHGKNRVCVMGTFNIYFKRTANQIYITCFWDNRQDPKRLTRILRRRNGT